VAFPAQTFIRALLKVSIKRGLLNNLKNAAIQFWVSGVSLSDALRRKHLQPCGETTEAQRRSACCSLMGESLPFVI
jgi:hypothetical protein